MMTPNGNLALISFNQWIDNLLGLEGVFVAFQL